MEVGNLIWIFRGLFSVSLMHLCVIYVTIRDDCRLFYIMVALSNLDQDLKVTLDYFYNSGDVQLFRKQNKYNLGTSIAEFETGKFQWSSSK